MDSVGRRTGNETCRDAEPIDATSTSTLPPGGHASLAARRNRAPGSPLPFSESPSASRRRRGATRPCRTAILGRQGTGGTEEKSPLLLVTSPRAPSRQAFRHSGTRLTLVHPTGSAIGASSSSYLGLTVPSGSRIPLSSSKPFVADLHARTRPVSISAAATASLRASRVCHEVSRWFFALLNCYRDLLSSSRSCSVAVFFPLEIICC